MQNGANGGFASYVCFGTAYGFLWNTFLAHQTMFLWMYMVPAHSVATQKQEILKIILMVMGHQGDGVRISNYLRLVRDIDGASGLNEKETDESLVLYPNPCERSFEHIRR